jgi:hypothetical protein
MCKINLVYLTDCFCVDMSIRKARTRFAYEPFHATSVGRSRNGP